MMLPDPPLSSCISAVPSPLRFPADSILSILDLAHCSSARHMHLQLELLGLGVPILFTVTRLLSASLLARWRRLSSTLSRLARVHTWITDPCWPMSLCPLALSKPLASSKCRLSPAPPCDTGWGGRAWHPAPLHLRAVSCAAVAHLVAKRRSSSTLSPPSSPADSVTRLFRARLRCDQAQPPAARSTLRGAKASVRRQLQPPAMALQRVGRRQ